MTRVVDIDTAVVSHSFSRTAQLLLKENPVLLSRLNLFINQAFGEKYPLGPTQCCHSFIENYVYVHDMEKLECEKICGFATLIGM